MSRICIHTYKVWVRTSLADDPKAVPYIIRLLRTSSEDPMMEQVLRVVVNFSAVGKVTFILMMMILSKTVYLTS